MSAPVPCAERLGAPHAPNIEAPSPGDRYRSRQRGRAYIIDKDHYNASARNARQGDVLAPSAASRSIHTTNAETQRTAARKADIATGITIE